MLSPCRQCNVVFSYKLYWHHHTLQQKSSNLDLVQVLISACDDVDLAMTI